MIINYNLVYIYKTSYSIVEKNIKEKFIYNTFLLKLINE